MNDFNLENVNSMYIDVLREIGNIGAGNAATSLATMLNTKVDMMVPRVELLGFNEIDEVMGGAEQVMAGIYLLVRGDITGSIMFLLEQESAQALVKKLMGNYGQESTGEMNEMERSTLKEIGNIITASYLNSLSAMTNMKIIASIPDLTIDMAGAILSVPAIEFGMLGDKLLMIQTTFTDEKELHGYFLLVPDLPSYEKLLRALGVITD
ncbi:MAG: chemotaxis protein CheC [Lachnospiraceae bacterium]|nr:chemotaxis protein CheC [Lachnospiraceae bacterium]